MDIEALGFFLFFFLICYRALTNKQRRGKQRRKKRGNGTWFDNQSYGDQAWLHNRHK